MKPRQHESRVFAAEPMVELGPAARLTDLGLCDYSAVYQLQQALVERRRLAAAEDLFLVTEHPATFTLGRRGGRQHLMVSEDFLRAKNIPLVHIERGGEITYHGPGQLVLYPIIHLRQAGLSVAQYVFLLEQLMIGLAAQFGVAARRDPKNHGVWVGAKKLGSIGIAIRHGISFHGLALNIENSLEPFSWVNPCGLAGVEMTTLGRECRGSVGLTEVKDRLRSQLQNIFNREFIPLAKDHTDVIMPQREKSGQTEMAQKEAADRAKV